MEEICLLFTVSGGLETLAEREIQWLLDTTTKTSASASIGNIEVGWRTKGNSGSQLSVIIRSGSDSGSGSGSEGDSDNGNDSVRPPLVHFAACFVRKSAQHLRFVDYMYLRLMETTKSLGTAIATDKAMNCNANAAADTNTYTSKKLLLLDKIQDSTASELSSAGAIINLDRALRLGGICQDILQDKKVGLEKLPGVVSTLKLLPNTSTPKVDRNIDIKKDSSLASPWNAAGAAPRQINTVFTKDVVAKAVVTEFVDLVRERIRGSKQRQQQVDTIDPANSNMDTDNNNDILWVDAGSGSGALLRHLPPKHSVGVDTYPNNDSILEKLNTLQANFLTVTSEELRLTCIQGNLTGGGCIQRKSTSMNSGNNDKKNEGIICVISNPPFSEGTRGNYSAIVQFINHAVDGLKAAYTGIIAPVKFARERVWASLGLSSRARLLIRFLLPSGSFFDPSDGKTRNISSVFLVFGRLASSADSNQTNETIKQDRELDSSSLPLGTVNDKDNNNNKIYIVGRRDKGHFPWLSTADFTRSVAQGLERAGAEISSEENSRFSIQAKLKLVNKNGSDNTNNGPGGTYMWMELQLLLNPKRPLSLSNSVSRTVADHSLGWLSSSVKPPVAHGMRLFAMSPNANGGDCNINTMDKNNSPVRCSCGLVINLMSGEGTIELEAQDSSGFASNNGHSASFFIISGDKDAAVAAKTNGRLLARLGVENRRRRPMVDIVVWDAQRLPLRKGIADTFLADLPFAGSRKKIHQVPSCAPNGNCDDGNKCGSYKDLGVDISSTPLDYKRIMAQAINVLRPLGRAVLLSPDAKAMVHAIRSFQWSILTQSNAVNLGGLSAKLTVMERRASCCKDLSAWVRKEVPALLTMNDLMLIANKACAKSYFLDEYLLLQERRSVLPSLSAYNTNSWRGCFNNKNLVDSVELHSVYLSEKTNKLSHCYRFIFDDRLTNYQTKLLEKCIRPAIETNLPSGILQLR